MRDLLSLLFATTIIALLAGCDGDVRTAHDNIQAPPASSSTSAATEDLLAQRTAAAVRQATAAADLKAALAELAHAKTKDDLAKAANDVTTARAEAAKEKATSQALSTALTDQQTLEASGRLDRFYILAILTLALGGFLVYEGAKKTGTGLMVVAGILAIAPMVLQVLLRHEAAVFATVFIAAAGCLICHYRKKIGALEATVEHLHLGRTWNTATAEVKEVLVATYQRLRGWASTGLHDLEALLHLKQAAPPAQVLPLTAVRPEQATSTITPAPGSTSPAG